MWMNQTVEVGARDGAIVDLPRMRRHTFPVLVSVGSVGCRPAVVDVPEQMYIADFWPTTI